MKYGNIGFVGPFGSANLGDYGILVNDIFDLNCRKATIFSYNFNWPKVQLDEYCSDIQYDYCVVKVKENYYADRIITTYSDEEILRGCENIEGISEHVKNIDTLMISGGGWINDFWAYRTEKIAKIATVIILAKRYGKSIKFMTQGLGPLGIFQDWYKNLFSGIEATICVRDTPSLKLGHEQLACTTALYPDDLLIPNKKWEVFESKLRIPQTQYVLVEPFVPMDVLEDNKTFIGEIADELYRRYRCVFYFMPFDLVHFGNEQAQYCHSLCKCSQAVDISNDLYPRYEDVISLIKGASLVITARYHGFVLALSNGVPVIHVVNTSHGDYGKIKSDSVLHWCLGDNIDKSTFYCMSFIDALKNVVNRLSEIRETQHRIFRATEYIEHMESARMQRTAFLQNFESV